MGSFGCNEASPECLDGGQTLLRDDGISIPASYSSWVAPLCSPKLYGEARSFAINDATGTGGPQGDPAYRDPVRGLETMYVVCIHNADVLQEAKELFSFAHPNANAGAPADNNRYGRASFTAPKGTEK